MSAPAASIAAIVLAAGASTRMGRPKQLLEYRGKTLIEHAVTGARTAGFDPVIVVLGANGDLVRTRVASLAVLVVENAEWQNGMGSSIACGVKALPGCAGAALLLADQPLVTADPLRAMRELFADEVVAARYAGKLGVPAIFPGRLFASLAALRGEEGARSILRTPAERVIPFDLPEAASDVDTLQDASLLS